MRRMLCTECSQTDRPNTLIGGSDLLELVLWACFVVPGLAYCGWRHASRRKVCAHCGSLHLVRESRAAQGRAGEASTSAGGRVVYGSRPLPFLAPPGTRFRRLTAGGAVASVALVSWAVVSLDLLRVRPAPHRPPAQVRAAVPPPSPEAQAAAQQARARAETDPSDHPSVRRYLRKRECQRLCNEFHGTNGAANRDCLARCMDELESDAMRGLEGCKDSLDPGSCPFLLGPP